MSCSPCTSSPLRQAQIPANHWQFPEYALLSLDFAQFCTAGISTLSLFPWLSPFPLLKTQVEGHIFQEDFPVPFPPPHTLG